jgi:hypothetical protein
MRNGDESWTNPNDEMGLWEYQLRPLNVRELLLALSQVDPELLVEVEHYDGSGEVVGLRPMHLDLRNRDGKPSAVVVTVH